MRWTRSGRRRTSRRELGDGELLARAAIGYEDACWRPAIADPAPVELLEEAAAALGGESSQLRVGLLGGLARALDFQGEHERGAIVVAGARSPWRGGWTIAWASPPSLVRSYWSRGASSLEEILEPCSPRRRTSASELGDTEIRAEAMAWRVPAFVALCDLDAADGRPAALRDRPRSRPRSRSCIHVAEHYGVGARAVRRAARARRRPSALRSHEWSRLLTGRDAAGVYGIQMFSIRREQGRLAELAPVIRILAAGATREAPWRPGLVCRARRARHGGARPGASSGGVAAEGLDQFRESLWLASLTYLADAVRGPRRRGERRRRLSRARAARGLERHDRPPGLLLRSSRSLPGHARGGRSAKPSAPRSTSSARMELNRRMGATTWLAHTAYEYARPTADARAGRARPGRSAARRGGRPGREHRHAGAARPHRALGAPHGAARPPRRSLRRARSRSSGSSPGASAIARSARRCSSASTPPPITSAASCARPAAPIAPRRPRTPTATA